MKELKLMLSMKPSTSGM